MKIKSDESLARKLSLRTTSHSKNESYSDILLDGNKIGEIAFSFYDDINAVGIGNFEISSEHRGKGYGTKVLEFVIDKYKKNVENSEMIVEQLKKCADSIEKLDYQMQEIRDGIDRG